MSSFLRCDECGKEAADAYNWYVIRNPVMGGEFTHHLCSLRCLGEWAEYGQRRAREIEEARA